MASALILCAMCVVSINQPRIDTMYVSYLEADTPASDSLLRPSRAHWLRIEVGERNGPVGVEGLGAVNGGVLY